MRGIKVFAARSRLEIALRDRYACRARVFTGDDYNYVDLIAGDAPPSDALLGAFAALARSPPPRSPASTTATSRASGASSAPPRR